MLQVRKKVKFKIYFIFCYFLPNWNLVQIFCNLSKRLIWNLATKKPAKHLFAIIFKRNVVTLTLDSPKKKPQSKYMQHVLTKMNWAQHFPPSAHTMLLIILEHFACFEKSIHSFNYGCKITFLPQWALHLSHPKWSPSPNINDLGYVVSTTYTIRKCVLVHFGFH